MIGNFVKIILINHQFTDFEILNQILGYLIYLSAVISVFIISILKLSKTKNSNSQNQNIKNGLLVSIASLLFFVFTTLISFVILLKEMFTLIITSKAIYFIIILLTIDLIIYIYSFFKTKRIIDNSTNSLFNNNKQIVNFKTDELKENTPQVTKIGNIKYLTIEEILHHTNKRYVSITKNHIANDSNFVYLNVYVNSLNYPVIKGFVHKKDGSEKFEILNNAETNIWIEC